MTKLEIAKKLIDKLTFSELHFTQGLHLIFEDGNIRTSDAEFCLEYSVKHSYNECALIAAIMLSCTIAERAELCNHGGYNGTLEGGDFYVG